MKLESNVMVSPRSRQCLSVKATGSWNENVLTCYVHLVL